MARYEVKLDIERDAAARLLQKLANADDPLRAELERGKQQAHEALKREGIEVSLDSLPDRINLPPASKVADFHTRVSSLVERDAQPFGFALLVVVFGAMPLVEPGPPEGDGTG